MCYKTTSWAVRQGQQHNLHNAERVLLIYLADFRNCKTGRCDPSLPHLIAATGLSRATIYRCRNKLQALGLVQHSAGGYSFPGLSHDETAVSHGETKLSHDETAPSSVGTEKEPRREQSTYSSPEGTQLARSSLKLEIVDELAADSKAFRDFWAIYPRTKGTSKADAHLQWRYAIKSGKITASALQSAAQEWADYCAHEGTAEKYIAHPAKWIKEGRYETIREAQKHTGGLFSAQGEDLVRQAMNRYTTPPGRQAHNPQITHERTDHD